MGVSSSDLQSKFRYFIVPLRNSSASFFLHACMFLLRMLLNVSRCRWLQSTVVNETDFRLTFDDANYQFRKGRFWTAPGNVAANSESTYSICNKALGFGVNGVVRYHLAVNPETILTIVINYRNEFFGDMVVTANIERDGASSKETTVLIDGVENTISVRSAPGNEAKITVFYSKETTPKPKAAAATPE